MATRFNQLSVSMRKALTYVMDGIKASRTSSFYNIELKFSTKINPAVSPYFTREIKKLTITQDFINNFTDKIIVELQLDQFAYKTLYYNRNDLFAELKFSEVYTNKVDFVKNTPTYSFKYRAVLIDSPDIFKRVSAEVAQPKGAETDRNQITLRVRIELIDDTIYKSRKSRLHGIFTDVTMQDMLNYTVGQFGFTKAVIVKPDNQRKYTNFVIPPDYGIADIMGYLQNAPSMGVYNNGFCSYVTDGTWYIYPRNGEAICRRIVHLYAAGNNAVVGLDKMNWTEALDDGDICNHIILNTPVTERNWSILGSENTPNAANIQSADAVLDYSRTLLQDGKFEARPVIRNIAAVPSDAMSDEDQVNISYVSSKDNLFTIQSDLGALQQTTLSFVWESCAPFAFRPATVVEYHYDHALGYRTISGKCEKVVYTFTAAENIRLFPVFSGTADVTIACENFSARQNGNI
jgi:hypothetical protein